VGAKASLARPGVSWSGLALTTAGEVVASATDCCVGRIGYRPCLPRLRWDLLAGNAAPPSAESTVVVGLCPGRPGTFNLGDSLSPLPERMPKRRRSCDGGCLRALSPFLYKSLLILLPGCPIASAACLHLGLLLAFVWF